MISLPRAFWPIVRAIVSVALLGWLFSRIDAQQLGSLLTSMDVRLWAGGLLSATAAWLVNTFKWRRLLETQGYPSSYLRLLALNHIGMFYSILLPGQLSGEVMKGFRLVRSGTPAEAIGVSILIDRLSGVLGLGLLGLFGLVVGGQPPNTGDAFVWLTVLVGLLAVVPIAVLIARASPDAVSASPTIFQRVSQALHVYRSTPSTLLLAVAGGIVFQALIVVSNYFVALAVGVEVPPLALAWIVSLVSIIAMLPLSLGGLGLREGSYALLLQLYYVPLPAGVSVSLAVFGIILVQGLAGGVAEVLWPRLSAAIAAPADATPRN